MESMFKTMLGIGVTAGLLCAIEGTGHAAFDSIGPLNFNNLCPTHIGGDREYSGHGPEVTTFIGIGRYSSDQIWIRTEMHQIETTSDWSQAQLARWFKITERFDGTNYTHIWANTGAGWQWIALPNGTYYDTFSDFYTDTNHGVRSVSPPDSWLNTVKTNGDTSGNDIGNCTSDDAYLSVSTPTLYFFYQ